MRKLVSIIIPTYKGGKSIARAIRTALNQTYENIEIIVVDDNGAGCCEQKETERAVSAFGNVNIIYLVHEKNMNGASARNTGLKKARGEYICFLDDDDLMLEKRVEDAVNFLEMNKKYDGVYADVVCSDEKLSATKVVRIKCEGDCTKNILLDDMFLGTGSNIFITRRAFERVGFFDERFLRHQDLEYMLRFYRFFKTGNTGKIEIIKSKNGINNIPKYDRLLKNEMLYNEVFREEIEKLSSGEKEVFLNNQNNMLLVSEVCSSKISVNGLKKYFSLSNSNKVLVAIIRLRINGTKIFKIMNSGIKKRKYFKIKMSLPSDVVAFLERYR